MARRTVPTYLNAHLETPQLGRKFKHSDVERWAGENRGLITWAALTLIQQWITAGRPSDESVKPLGMFESWSAVVGGILKAAGIGGFLGGLRDFYDAAVDEEQSHSPFIHAWFAEFGERFVLASELVQLAKTHLELVKPVAGFPAGTPSPRQVGKYLAKIKKGVYGGIEVVHVPRSGRADQYRVFKTN